MRKIVTAFDHAGVDLREIVHKTIRECGCEVLDVGTDSKDSVDFPDFAYLAAQKILSGEADKGVFVCGSGVGMCLAANKIKGIYASVCHDTYSAHQAVEHDNLNVLCLGSRVIGPELARELVTAYLSASFNNMPNQIRRMDKIRRIEDCRYEPKNIALRVYELGQSIWLDNIRRGMIKNGRIAADISNGTIRGITSNPTIFRKAVKESRDYENTLLPMALANTAPDEIYTQLVVQDARDAADLFRDLYIQSQGNEGFVSLEISPLLAHDAEATIAEAKSIWKSVNRPNLMIKFPVTDESLAAVTELTANGLNLNLTLIFSLERYEQAANAYIEGLRKRLAQGEPIAHIRSVASVFVSRVDVKVDALLTEKGFSARNLIGKSAIRNAQRIYNKSMEIFGSDAFSKIKERGGKEQRVLWASVGTKNPQQKLTYYAESLIGKNTVCTLPPATLDAFLKTGMISKSLPANPDEVTAFFTELEETGVDLKRAFMQLENEGIEAFISDYRETIEAIEQRCDAVRRNVGLLQTDMAETTKSLEQNAVMRRIFSKDPTVWTFNTQAFSEIRNRLGWLDTYKNTESLFSSFVSLRKELKKEGISTVLLMGMVGFSLAPEVIANVFKDECDIKLQIIDSTDPLQIRQTVQELDPQTTLYIVSSKSGSTPEIHALLDYFFHQSREALGNNTGNHFVAITDPGSALEKIAKDLGFRAVYFSDFSVGGRFSALTAFGLLPAMLLGLDPEQIGLKVNEAMKSCSPSLSANRNEGAALGSFIGTAAKMGRDKLTILTDPEFISFGTWLEQLIAESSGKDGKGIIPIVNEPYPEGQNYADDRCFVYINYNNSHSEELGRLKNQGHPVFEIAISSKYDLFGEFYRWEIADAVACSIIGVNAFDQPDVHECKSRTAAKISEYHKCSRLSDIEEIWSDTETAVSAPDNLGDLSDCRTYNDVITKFIAQCKAGRDFVALNAYLPQSSEMFNWLQKLRSMILRTTGCATSIAFGPCFLHSTAQLHNGGPNTGLFIQIVADYSADIDIPEEDISFGILERAQAIGDFESLNANDRRVMRIRFKNGLPKQE